MKEAGKSHGRRKYTFGGVCFISCKRNGKPVEITSFPSADRASSLSGTKVSDPEIVHKLPSTDPKIVLEKSCNPTSPFATSLPLQKWTSHTVLVVDMSGSMRRDDLNGARCRSDGVWLVLARDHVKRQLDLKSAGPTDMISIVLMMADAEVLCSFAPMSYHLFNLLVDMREFRTKRPAGPGNYLPALEKAEELLEVNSLGTCALSLLILSDGRPSDRGNFKERMGNVAARFGRRLSLSCIGMASADDDDANWNVLKSLVDEAKSYGSIASFNQPSMNQNSLSCIVSSLATSLTETKTEITDLKTGKARIIKDVRLERINAGDDENLTENWKVYASEDSYGQYVDSSFVWSSNLDMNDFATIQVSINRCALKRRASRSLRVISVSACYSNLYARLLGWPLLRLL